jgi:hypothetical protein
MSISLLLDIRNRGRTSPIHTSRELKITLYIYMKWKYHHVRFL